MIIRNEKCWELSQSQKAEYVEKLTAKLAALRAQADISQEELANIIGVSRQTYCAIESQKRRMSWSTYLSLIFFYDSVEETSQMLRGLGVYPTELIGRFRGTNDVNVTKREAAESTYNVAHHTERAFETATEVMR